MTKDKKESSQLTMYDWIKSQAEKTGPRSNPSPGSPDINKELKAAMSEDLRHDEIIQKNKTEKLKKMIYLKEIERG